MAVVIRKLGGTCLGPRGNRERCVERVVDNLGQDSPVVVVSAMGRKGDPYATDTLLGLLDRPDPGRNSDMLLACGEIIAAVVFSSWLEAAGIRSQPLAGWEAGICTDERHGEARILAVDTRGLERLLDRGVVPVVAGFQGRSPEGHVTTLGRGGSDITAVALGVALGARHVELFKDVPGVLNPEGRVLSRLSYQSAFRLASNGARVIHPDAVERAGRAGLPLWVRPLEGEGPGTWIRGEEREHAQNAG
ncbi:MAG: hypothetical protein AB1445_04780 [Bacillota bacterium]